MDELTAWSNRWATVDALVCLVDPTLYWDSRFSCCQECRCWWRRAKSLSRNSPWQRMLFSVRLCTINHNATLLEVTYYQWLRVERIQRLHSFPSMRTAQKNINSCRAAHRVETSVETSSDSNFAFCPNLLPLYLINVVSYDTACRTPVCKMHYLDLLLTMIYSQLGMCRIICCYILWKLWYFLQIASIY